MAWRIDTTEISRFLDTLSPQKMRELLLMFSAQEESFVLATQKAGVLQCVLPACKPVPIPQCPYLHYDAQSPCQAPCTEGMEHAFTIMLSIPRRSMGAVTHYDAMRECRHCGQLIPASILTPSS